jgi:hypothetical protein
MTWRKKKKIEWKIQNKDCGKSGHSNKKEFLFQGLEYSWNFHGNCFRIHNDDFFFLWDLKIDQQMSVVFLMSVFLPLFASWGPIKNITSKSIASLLREI